ncbi:glycosyltransferase family 25 protein [uncultured Vibrio sp.]|uniref:glycosyltransferase family 25 protein n=1 Tax=uncultured Vibrio sp. TaxID=114054 RepID=UPI002AA82F8B|nr:glycosyltransferase family 25 protein [uncultured Vibrio sp.]
MLKIFVINLLEAVERRAAIEKQLLAFKLDYEIFLAINGRLLTEEEKKSCYDDAFR